MSNLAILVVEDHDAVRHMLGLALQGFGFSVHLASCGTQAVEIYQRESIDVVLLDVQMPGIDGPETLAALKKINPRVVCCFMSGYSGQYEAEDLLRLGSAGILQKPFPLEELREFILRSASTEGRGPEPTEQQLPQLDRRGSPRLTATTDVKVACFIGCLSDGQNQAIAVLDFSETGVRLLLKDSLAVGQEVVVKFQRPSLMWETTAAGRIVWLDKKEEIGYLAGVSLDQSLPAKDAICLN